MEDVPMPDSQFVRVAFDDETHQDLSKNPSGRGRKGKLTREGRAEMKVVKSAGGQCERCRTVKKKVRSFH